MIPRRCGVVLWSLEWECCTLQKIDYNSFKSTMAWSIHLKTKGFYCQKGKITTSALSTNHRNCSAYRLAVSPTQKVTLSTIEMEWLGIGSSEDTLSRVVNNEQFLGILIQHFLWFQCIFSFMAKLFVQWWLILIQWILESVNCSKKWYIYFFNAQCISIYWVSVWMWIVFNCACVCSLSIHCQGLLPLSLFQYSCWIVC